MISEPRVVIVHDYVTQRGGAERVTLNLLRAFPGARLITSVWDRSSSFPEFADHEVETMWLDRYSLFREDPRRAFPFLARAFGRQQITDADIVICSTSGWAHRVRTAAPKIVYCHNPARWLYQPDDYLHGVSPWLRRRFVSATNGLRHSDVSSAWTADRYLANSGVVASRIKAAYGIDASVVHPSRGLSVDGPREAVPGVEPGFLLTIARDRGYKNTQTVARAVAGLPGERLVVVGSEVHLPGVTSLTHLTDPQMRWLFDNASGLVAVAFEDFGLTVVEAQSFGVPAVALRAGGYVDTGVEHATTVFVDSVDSDAVAAGIRELRSRQWHRQTIRTFGERFSAEVFQSRMRDIVGQVLDGGPPVPDAHRGFPARLVPVETVTTSAALSA